MAERRSRTLLLCGLAMGPLVSSSANAGVCTGEGNVIQVFQWDDGNIFVTLNQPTNCQCSLPQRVAFHKDANEKFFMACAVHGNTAVLLGLGILS